MKNLSDISIQYVKGVGPARKKMFAQLGIATIEDLFYFFPRRYEDRSHMVPIAQLKLGESQVIKGRVLLGAGRRTWFTKKRVFEIVVDDNTGRLTCVWFNQPYLEHYFKMGTQAIFYGKVEVYKNRLQMVSPEYEIIAGEEADALSVDKIVPIYPLTKGMSQRYLRKVLKNCLDRYTEQLSDLLPVYLRNKYHLPNIRRSIHNLHFPENFQEQEEAHRRVSFEEFFFFQISVILRRMSITKKTGVAHRIDLDLINRFAQAFPFSLTAAQRRVINEIIRDMSQDSPMLRLLQGDVGSGKTLVALFGCVAAFHNGFQSAVMAPTEILARQHYENIKEIIKGFKNSSNPKICLLTSSVPAKEREKILQDIKGGKIDIVVGTHALLGKEVVFKNLSFAVIDEQHKFGVQQRALLSEKGTNPDILIMTATPIPRTLCMTLYGDLDVSILDEMPPGRGKITTRSFSEEQAKEVYALIREMVKAGRQAYIVYPLVEESATLDLKAAQKMFADFQKQEFKGLRLGLVHGQMKRKEADIIMQKFKNKEIDILVATTILEVGIDVPNAGVMAVEHAERFGLSQLHQLRGRVGRGAEDALCLLIAGPQTDDGKARLEAILSTNDGFKIAECDLLIRGPGHYFGRHQHGLNELKVANPVKQIDILELARHEAKELVHQDPDLTHAENVIIKETIQKRYPQYLEMVEAG